MPNFNTNKPKYKPKEGVKKEWKEFKKGLNTLLRPTELDNQTLAKADNVMLKGSGTIKGRWGTELFFEANSTGICRGFAKHKTDSNDDYMVLTDEGYLAKKSGTSYNTVTGQSWPSGSTIKAEQLGGKTYIVSEDVAFTEYDGSNLSRYATISKPTGLQTTNLSGVTGLNRQSYRVAAIGPNGGNTLPSDSNVEEYVPDDLSDTSIQLYWTAPSAVSLTGFEIYSGRQGDETFLGTTDPNVTTFTHKGAQPSDIIVPPESNTTGGIESKFIKKYKNRLIAVDANNPSKLLISGIYPYHTKFDWISGGGYLYIDPESGDDITGIEVQPITDRIIVYKNYSSYIVKLQTINIAGNVILDPVYEPVSTSVGCSNVDTIATVENDTFYFGRDGIYVTGYEPQFLNILRTNEISARIRPEFDGLSQEDYQTACAEYINNKYILSFPYKKKMIIYDRERGAFAGIWKMPYGVNFMDRYVDDSGTEHWVLGSNDSNKVYKFNVDAKTDDGTIITKKIKTNKEYFNDWTLLNILEFFYVLFNSVTGTVNVSINIEDKDGETSTAKAFSISGSEVSGKTGWGINTWGSKNYGESDGGVISAGAELTRWGTLFKRARHVQIEVSTSTASSDFELLKIMISAKKQSRGSLSSSQKV